jgi:hypothetical protein
MKENQLTNVMFRNKQRSGRVLSFPAQRRTGLGGDGDDDGSGTGGEVSVGRPEVKGNTCSLRHALATSRNLNNILFVMFFIANSVVLACLYVSA